MMHQMVIIGNIKEILVLPFEEMYYYENLYFVLEIPLGLRTFK